MMQRKHMIATVVGAVALVVMTATASALITKQNVTADEDVISETVTTRKEVKAAPVRHSANQPVQRANPEPAPQQVAQQPACDDGNIAGTVLGGAAGGVIGSQIGNGSGQTAATIAGVAGGALLGREYIPTRNITCR
jgi:uncharacterized protein YcfJ